MSTWPQPPEPPEPPQPTSSRDPDRALADDAAPIAPVSRGARIATIDVLRGVAVLGILLMNIIAFGLPHWAYDDPSVAGGATGLNLWTWIATNMLFEGTMRAMFSLLFGAGVILLTSRLESRLESAAPGSLTTADIYFRRNMWLIVFGMVDAYLLLWLGDILYVYGVVGMFLYVFRRLQPKRLMVISAVLLAVITARSLYERHQTLTLISDAARIEIAKAAGETLSDDDEDTLDQWKEKREELKPDAEGVQEEIDEMHKGYLPLVLSAAPINLWLQTKYLFKHSFLDAASMMFLGMALMKLGVLTGRSSSRTYWLMMALGYAAGLSVNAFETVTIMRGQFSIESFAQASLTYDFGRLAMVIGHIGAIMLILRAGFMPRLAVRLAAVGQMALTNYLSTTVVCSLIFNGYGLGLYGDLQRWQLYFVVLGVWIAQLWWSAFWLARFQFGPAEWLWRSLTYWKRQPVLRTEQPIG